MANTPHEPPTDLIRTDGALIAGCRNLMDRSSWDRFYQIYRPMIFSVALKSGLTVSEAEDVVQETMASAARHMPGFKYNPATGTFRAWLLNMTRWRITDQLRMRGPQAPLPERPEDTELGYQPGVLRAHVMPELEELWNAEWKKHLTDVALARVKRDVEPRQYQIFDFYVNKEWPAEQVAKSFDVSVSQVYLAKSRIMELVDQEVERLMKEMN